MKIAVLGSGGHAEVVAAILSASDQPLEFAGFVAPEANAGEFSDAWLGTDDDLESLFRSGALDAVVSGIGSIKGSAELRSRVFHRARQVGIPAISVRHPRSIIDPNVTMGDGVVVMAGAVINTGSKVGHDAIINTGSIVDHHAKIGNHVHIAPGSVLSGNVEVGDHSLIGVGAVIKQSVRIGKNVTVGAGAVVVHDIPDGQTAIGVPAKPV